MIKVESNTLQENDHLEIVQMFLEHVVPGNLEYKEEVSLIMITINQGCYSCNHS